MISLKRANDNLGFTLLEVIMAMAIFAIVVSAVYGSYSTTFSIVHALEFQDKTARKGRISMERIAQDLESVYLLESGFIHGQRGDSLRFTSTAHLLFGKKEIPAGYAIIRYSVEYDEQSGLLKLYRSDKAYRPGIEDEEEGADKGYLLCDGLTEVRFTYFDRQGDENDGWNSEEDDSDEEEERKLPARIEIVLGFGKSLESEERTIFKTAVSLPVYQ